jgi:hypothetical protein
MFSSYPKKRPPLPDGYKKIYQAHYIENREGRSLASALSTGMERWMHRQMAQDVLPNGSGKSTLEIGAGTLNHLPYEPNTDPYDVIEPFSRLLEESTQAHRIRHIYKDLYDIPNGIKYDRILAIATLEHLVDLPRIVAAAALLLQDSGTFRAATPNEGSWAWALGWNLTTGLEFRLRRGLDYSILLKHEHVNTAQEIEGVLDYFYDRVECGFMGLSKTVAFYRSFVCSSPHLDRCTEYLKSSPEYRESEVRGQ